jgi:putative hydrolase of the HAD superfamily/pyrimidine and pyridine-specific 5'-nucleotidase|tara:strand:+ start:203 stop:904 length:702 start_codon:yes stop_codon:yes gene_type:complete
MAVVFFDCDDCLYQNDWNTAGLLTARIDEFCVSQLHLPTGKAYQLYKQHGTCLKGLTEEKLMPDTPEAIDQFLEYCHDVPLDDIQPDQSLRAMIQRVTKPRWVFTASVKSHALRCLKQLGIDDLFLGIIDCKAVGLVTKHSKEAFERAMAIAGATDPSQCYFVDDSTPNIQTAHAMGWKTACVGPLRGSNGESMGEDVAGRVCEGADHCINTVHDMPTVFPELFLPSNPEPEQ